MIYKTKVLGLIAAVLIIATPVSAAETKNYIIDNNKEEATFVMIPGEFVCPLQEQTIVLSPFSHDRATYFHEGIDLKAEEGTPVYAVADGKVTKAEPDSKGVNKGGGKMIFIEHENGVESRYMHLSGYAVNTGDTVKVGQLIGYTGNTGDSTTPHLHYEYRVNGMPSDPAFIFEQSGCIDSKYSVTMPNLEDNQEKDTPEDMSGFYIVQQ